MLITNNLPNRGSLLTHQRQTTTCASSRVFVPGMEGTLDEFCGSCCHRTRGVMTLPVQPGVAGFSYALVTFCC